MHPPHHVLAALLVEQGHYDKAEQIYRESNCAPSIPTTFGHVECLQMTNDRVQLAALQQKLAYALAMADMPITPLACVAG
jgi:hypothetical protein